MLDIIRNFALNQQLKKNKFKGQFSDWASVKSIGFVLINDVASLNAVKAFMNESGKQVDLITYFPDKTTNNADVYLSVNKKSFSWIGLPNPETLQKLQSKSYDVLICCDMNGVPSLKTLTFLAKAKCKVGVSEIAYSSQFDISISSKGSDGIGNFLKQVLKYLMMFKAN
jgi:hypothetical protein